LEHFYIYDVKNKRNNVIVNFGSSEYIENSIKNMKNKSKESIPLLIIIDNVANYDKKLKYINYIPNIDNIIIIQEMKIYLKMNYLNFQMILLKII